MDETPRNGECFRGEGGPGRVNRQSEAPGALDDEPYVPGPTLEPPEMSETNNYMGPSGIQRAPSATPFGGTYRMPRRGSEAPPRVSTPADRFCSPTRLPEARATPSRRITGHSGIRSHPVCDANAPPNGNVNGARTYSWEEVEALLAQNSDKITTSALRLMEARTPAPITTPGGDAYSERILKTLDRSLGSPRRKDMNVESYGGEDNEDWPDYVTKFAAAAKWNRWDNDDKFQQLIGHLKGNALALYVDYRPKSYYELVAVITDRYAPKGNAESFKLKFRSMTMDWNGDPSVFAQKLARNARRAYPNWSNDVLEEQVFDQFKQGLIDVNMRRHITLGKHQTLSEAVIATSAFQRFEESTHPSRTAKPVKRLDVPAKCAAAPADAADGVLSQALRDEVAAVCAVMKGARQDNATKLIPSASNGDTPYKRSATALECWCCHELGHDHRHCPKNADGHYQMTAEESQRDTSYKDRKKARRGRGNTTKTTAPPLALPAPGTTMLAVN